MFEIFIWLMVSDRRQHHWEPMSFSEADEQRMDVELDFEPERLRDKVRLASAYAGLSFDVLTLRDTYAGVAVSAGFGRNHALPTGTERQFLEHLASSAPTTYGVIYTRDSDEGDVHGEFKVIKLANQQISETFEILVPNVANT
ncbi:MAG: hypothetical protein K2W81_05340 [Sphingomonas sp.]|uniref:Imm7 family immunity protein n=1 Tax=Sphingomonas sp. TaxID=28214 RepID=UPI0025CE73EF|nr:Imm7 family immunity protein [Sphingomonas sp.]MBY0283370.1 hypothetical protein [Sphingomonas sp.]